MTSLEAGPAILSPDRRYRYTLERRWAADSDGPRTIAWIGLNPSTADESELDPTLRRIMDFSRSWGFDAFVMLNLFAYRATSPEDMKAQAKPTGRHNDAHIRGTLLRPEVQAVVACWGVHGAHRARSVEVAEIMDECAPHCRPYHLGLTNGGQPKHPLYLPKTTMFMPFDAHEHMIMRGGA